MHRNTIAEIENYFLKHMNADGNLNIVTKPAPL